MNIIQAQSLGEAGQVIPELLQDLHDVAFKNETRDMVFDDECPKENLENKLDYFNHTIEMIQQQLITLQQKQC